MAAIGINDKVIVLRKTVAENGGRYTVFLQHNYTRVIYRLTPENISSDEKYYHFELELPSDAPLGEYTLYVTPYSPFFIYETDPNDIRRSCVCDIDRFNPLVNGGELILNDSQPIYNNIQEAGNTCGKLVTYLSGILQYFDFTAPKSYDSPKTFNSYER